MIEAIRELHQKKSNAIYTTQCEIEKVETNIERKERIIAKLELDIENQRAAIEDKEDKKAELEAKLAFQTERAETLARYVAEYEALDAELDEAYARKTEISQWGMDLDRMRADKADPNSEFNVLSRRIDELYKERKRKLDFANAEYHQPYVR